MFYTWGASGFPNAFGYPICSDAPHMLRHPEMPPCSYMFEHPLICHQCSPVHLHVLGYLPVFWGCREPSFGHPHVFGCLPSGQHPHTLYAPLHVYVLGVIACAMGEHPICWGALAHLSGFWCLSVHPLDVHYASSCTFLVVHYVSSICFCHYNYYSSSDCGVFWYIISIICDYGTLFDGTSYNVGSA